jgi:tetratricopeptide (TPR) repeat protein
MRTKQIVWVLAACAFASILYAQTGQQMPTPQELASSFCIRPGNMESKQAQNYWVQTQASRMAQNPAQSGQKGKSQAQGPVPLTEKEVLKEIKSPHAETVIKDVKERGVDFDTTPEIEKKLRKAKASEEVVAAVKQAGPKVRAQMAKLMGPGGSQLPQVPREQAQAYDQIKTELDPDKAIALGEDFIKKYPDSFSLPFVYFFTANGYQQKGNVEKVAEYTGKGLKLKPDNMACLVMRVGILPQPQYLNNHSVERHTILDEAERDANHALELIAKMPKLPNESDQEYKKRIDGTGSQVHGSLGMIYLERAADSLAGPDKTELEKAEQEFKTAVTSIDPPYAGDYFYMGEAYKLERKYDDAIAAYTKASKVGQGTAIKPYADNQIERMKKLKALKSAAVVPESPGIPAAEPSVTPPV